MQKELDQLQLQVSQPPVQNPAASPSSSLLGSELPSPIAAQNQYSAVDPFMAAPKRQPGLQWNLPGTADEFRIGTLTKNDELDFFNSRTSLSNKSRDNKIEISPAPLLEAIWAHLGSTVANAERH